MLERHTCLSLWETRIFYRFLNPIWGIIRHITDRYWVRNQRTIYRSLFFFFLVNPIRICKLLIVKRIYFKPCILDMRLFIWKINPSKRNICEKKLCHNLADINVNIIWDLVKIPQRTHLWVAFKNFKFLRYV